MNRGYDRKIVLEDGAEFYGYGFGSNEERQVEVVFNTSMVGYDDSLSRALYKARPPG